MTEINTPGTIWRFRGRPMNGGKSDPRYFSRMEVDMQGKVWGVTECIEKNSSIEVHRMEVLRGGQCSRHLHKSKHNLFLVVSGGLLVETFAEHDRRVVITSGRHYVVPPGVEHQFTALEDTVAFEVYWAELDGGDIRRVSLGTMLSPDKLADVLGRGRVSYV